MSSNALIDSLKSNNSQYSSDFSGKDVPGRAGKKLLILTCMDSRIIPHEVFGLDLGDVKVVRNAGGQLNPEVEKDIVLASHLLDCHTIVIMPHTKCAMASLPLADVRQKLTDMSGKDFSEFNPRMIEDAHFKLRNDVESLRTNQLLKDGVEVFGAIYDVDTGQVNWLN